MMDSNNKLGILVNSDEHFDYVLKLTDAAISKGKQVQIHLLDKGVSIVFTDLFDRLNAKARISACSEGIRTIAGNAPFNVPDTVEIVSPHQFPRILKGVDRTVVF